jgi:hypothetical protein
MRTHLTRALCFLAGLALLSVAGCDRGSSGPPPALAVEQIPAEMQKAYSKATAEVKDVVTQLSSTLQNKDYPAAYQVVQVLCNLPVATREQRLVTARAMLTITGLLQTAQAQGDQNAAAVLSFQKKTK